MLADLAAILGIDAADVPPVFLRPKPHALKIGIRNDLTARYVGADNDALGVWFQKWCGTSQYLTRIANGQNRHDLDGGDYGVISDAERAQAKAVLKKRRAKKTASQHPLDHGESQSSERDDKQQRGRTPA